MMNDISREPAEEVGSVTPTTCCWATGYPTHQFKFMVPRIEYLTKCHPWPFGSWQALFFIPCASPFLCHDWGETYDNVAHLDIFPDRVAMIYWAMTFTPTHLPNAAYEHRGQVKFQWGLVIFTLGVLKALRWGLVMKKSIGLYILPQSRSPYQMTLSS